MNDVMEQMAEALRRTERNLRLAAKGVPVRDMDENIMENASVLAAYESARSLDELAEQAQELDMGYQHDGVESTATPDGWTLIPNEPTEEMCEAWHEGFGGSLSAWSRNAYKAMLAAAPKAPQQTEAQARDTVIHEHGAAMFGFGFRAGFIEATGWSDPVPQDADSLAFDVAKSKAIDAAIAKQKGKG